MALDNNPEKKPLGNRIRDLINPALEDERRRDIQLRILDEIFSEISNAFPRIMEQGYKEIFNRAAQISDPKEKNSFIITGITLQGGKGGARYNPQLQLGLPISTTFTDFSIEDIKGLKGYIKLHMTAREMDVALKVAGLTADEAKGGHPASLIIDGMKTYGQGAMENSSYYPNLPDSPPFDSRKGGDFKL